MVENSRRWLGQVWLAGAVVSCGSPDVTQGRYQGMIEYDQRELSFEMPGRVAAVLAVLLLRLGTRG